MRIARLTRAETAALMLDIAREPSGRPVFMTSANGQVMSQVASDPAVKALFAQADLISADGQPMVIVSRLLSKTPLPERCATTDLYEDVSRLAPAGTRYFLLGATAEEIERAAAVTRQRYPHIDICGFSHGFVAREDEAALTARINALSPDILWVGQGSPREQQFVVRNKHRLPNVKIIKTSGGLFNFVSGSNRRAPAWLQSIGFEWLFRLCLEPRRLLRRYAWTNLHGIYLLTFRTA